MDTAQAKPRELSPTGSPTSAAMKHRKLRIAWSLGCGILCLLLIALWVRSYWSRDNYGFSFFGRQIIDANSMYGQLTFNWYDDGPEPKTLGLRTMSVEDFLADMERSLGRPAVVPRPHFRLLRQQPVSYLLIPHWSVVLVIAVVAGASWLPFRFSLRTLLIGMTMIAALLGFVIWAAE
jgi:hypothetical protein